MFKEHKATDRNCAMTLIELLFVIVVIGILVAMLFPARSGHGYQGRSKAKARVEISNIETAIQQYSANYARWPVSTNVEQSGLADFTFGTAGTAASTAVTNGSTIEANNSEIMSAIMDMNCFRNGKHTPNHDGALNPRRIAFLVAQIATDNKSGLGEDGVYRDPWGNPYIITIDLNNDGMCCDTFYSQSSNRVMVWSFGPDGKADPNTKANQGVNKDNVLSWDNH
jgi:prepilin-type N-terminal cleavage/methylation domain-containing protein